MILIKNNQIEFLILVTVLSLGIFFRFYDLGNPGFWGDEETSSMPAKSLAIGNGANFPSGMEYRRALPQTYLNALSAKAFGDNRDCSYRVSSSIFGIATLFLIFIGTARFLGAPVALTVTTLLAFSEWHIILSRTARMYGPLLFFSLSFCFAALNWHFKAKNDLPLIAACILFIIATTFNYLAIVVLPILFIPVIFQKFDKRNFILSLASTIALGVAATVYFKTFLNIPYKEIKSSLLARNSLADNSYITFLDSFNSLLLTDLFLISTGLFIGGYLFFKSKIYINTKDYPLISLGSLIAMIALCLFILYGKAYGAIICTIFILLFISKFLDKEDTTALKILAIAIIANIFILVINIYNYGMESGLKESLNYPFPYILYQSLHFAGVVILFTVGIFESIFSPKSKEKDIIKSLAVAILLPLFMLGLILEWAPPRYLVATYPLLLIVASYGFICLLDRVKLLNTSPTLKIILALLVPASGILGGHGIPQAISVAPSEYGANIYSNHISGIKYPDHRSHGCFVKKHLQDGDIIVAEDALQMHWYIGRVDYWLRSPSTLDDFLYLDNNNKVRDIYVNSKPTYEVDLKSLSSNIENRIWVITSGETQQHTDHFLKSGSPQRDWLDTLIKTQAPVLKGRDGISATYCLNCEFALIEANPWNYDCQ